MSLHDEFLFDVIFISGFATEATGEGFVIILYEMLAYLLTDLISITMSSSNQGSFSFFGEIRRSPSLLPFCFCLNDSVRCRVVQLIGRSGFAAVWSIIFSRSCQTFQT